MGKSIYVINPSGDFPTYFGSEVYQGWGLDAVAGIGDLASVTVAALIPEDFEVELCDEYLDAVDFDKDADFVAITGKVSQWARMKIISEEFRRRGKTVMIGGPFASLSPEVVRGHCDILVRGEMEEIAEKVFADLREGSWEEEYEGTRPALDISPAGRWDLYPNHRARMGSVQTSRGCPFECEFCDVIQYLGRLQRHKPIANVLQELDILYSVGYRIVFLADDNFTIVRRRAKELLVALRDWNLKQTEGKVTFITQLSIDAARDDELLRMCSEAGLTQAFIGIETPNEDSLKEAKKRQNTGINLVDEIQKFYDYGIMVFGGMIVGFDNDGPDIFKRQYEFAMMGSMPLVTMATLVAPAATPLYTRIKKEGRLVDDSEMQGSPWNTNILPLSMSREQLFEGTRWLANKLYHPDAFAERTLSFIRKFGHRLDPRKVQNQLSMGFQSQGQNRIVDKASQALLSKLVRKGEQEARMVNRVLEAASKKMDTFEYALGMLVQYAQVRYMYEQGQFWEPMLAATPQPSAAA